MNPQIREMPVQPVNADQVGGKPVLDDNIFARVGQLG